MFFSDGDTKVINNVSLTIDKGDYISIVGPSGSGKSTLLKLCSDLISPTSGDIIFDGISIGEFDPTEYRKRVGYCFQQPYLFGRTVGAKISYPYDIRKLPIDESRVEQIFDLFHMSLEYRDKKNSALSGGEKQRICLIRSLLFLPGVLLLDEVTSSLDQENTLLIESVLNQLHKIDGLTILAVTHNEEQSKRNVNRWLTVVGGEIAKWEGF